MMNRWILLLFVMLLPVTALAQDYSQFYRNAQKRYDNGLYESAYKNYDLYVDLTADMDTVLYVKYVNMLAAERLIEREREYKGNSEILLAALGYINYHNPKDSLLHKKARQEWEAMLSEHGKKNNSDYFIDLTHQFQDANSAIEATVTNWLMYDEGFDRDSVKHLVDSLSLSRIDRRLYFVNGVFIQMVWNGDCYISTMPITESLYFSVILNNPICGYEPFEFDTYGKGNEIKRFMKRLNKISGLNFVNAVGNYLVLYEI